jgi:hypothetical protein
MNAPKTIKRRSIHSDRLERWLGAEKIAHLSKAMTDGGGPGKRWYGRPINIRDLPGSVWIGADGDFIGTFERGVFDSAVDSFERYCRRLWREAGRQAHEPLAAAGFASISEVLSRASQGYSQALSFNKNGPTGVANVTSSLWRVGAHPAAGAAGSAAPGGRAPTNTTTGALFPYTNPASGTMHLTGITASSSVINMSVLIYDRIFDVAKTMNSTATEAVTGVPTRYQSSTTTSAEYSGDNFLFIEVGGTALAATAHNWTVCTYTDQDGNTGATLPSVTGNSSAIVDRLDQPTNTWFCPLATGDNGIKALTQMQCSAAVATGAVNFVIGHPIAWMSFPVASVIYPFDWMTNVDPVPRLINSSCLAGLEVNKPATTATTYTGRIVAVNAAA